MGYATAPAVAIATAAATATMCGKRGPISDQERAVNLLNLVCKNFGNFWEGGENCRQACFVRKGGGADFTVQSCQACSSLHDRGAGRG